MEKTKPNTPIDWEQRRWELTQKLFFWSEFLEDWKDAIEVADEYIEEYKKSLNTEKTQE